MGLVGLGSARCKEVKMDGDRLPALNELSQAGGTEALRQTVPTGLICALTGDVHGALGTQRKGTWNPVPGMWSGRASWRKWYPKLTL